jgi:hypothetical protein
MQGVQNIESAFEISNQVAFCRRGVLVFWRVDEIGGVVQD